MASAGQTSVDQAAGLDGDRALLLLAGRELADDRLGSGRTGRDEPLGGPFDGPLRSTGQQAVGQLEHLGLER